jgi:O-antigen/teichoic acid export membrane protein
MNGTGNNLQAFLHTVARQSSTVTLGRGALLILGLGSNILLARTLGTAGVGKFQLGFVLVQLVTSFCILGLDKALMRYFPVLEANGQGGRRRLLYQGVGVVLTISVFFSAVLLISAPILATSYFHSDQMKDVVRMFCLYLPFFALVRFLGGAVAAIRRADFASNITNILMPAIFLVALAGVAVTRTGIYGAIAARSLSGIVAVVFLSGFLLRRLPDDPASGRKAQNFKGYLALSMPLFFVGLGYLLLGQMDTIMLGHFVDASELGIYSVAVRISVFVIIGLDILLPIVGPFWAHLAETRDALSTSELFAAVTKWTCYSGLFLFALITIFRAELLRIFGKAFEAGAPVLLVLSLGQLFNAVSGPTGQLLSMTGRQKLEVVNTVAMVLVNFLLNLFLIPRMGIMGAAIATGVSVATINGIKLVEVNLLYGLQPYSVKFFKGIAAVLAAGLVGYSARIWLSQSSDSPYWIICLAGGLFFLTATAGLWILGLDEDDKVALLALRRRKITVGAAVAQE